MRHLLKKASLSQTSLCKQKVEKSVLESCFLVKWRVFRGSKGVAFVEKWRGEMTLVWRSDAHPEFCHVKNMYEDFDFRNFAIVSIIGN